MTGRTQKKRQVKGKGGKKTGRKSMKSVRKSRKSQTGGCGCSKPSLIGGTNNLGSLPIRYYYPYNKNPDYLMEPITGGKKKRPRGGGLLGGIYSFGSVIDLQNASQLVGAQSLTETSVLDHPAAKVFQENNLVAI
jgi:hypothetical protein